jgi:hypothetical protein
VAGDTNAARDVFVHDPGIPPVDASWSDHGAGYPGTNGIPALTPRADRAPRRPGM